MIASIERGDPSPTSPSIVFVHGAMHGAWSWDEHFLGYFADRGRHVIALDLRGHGDSPIDRSVLWASVRDYLDDLAEVADRLPNPPVLVGHSLGGFVVQRRLEEHPAPAAVLVGATPPSGAMRLTLRAIRHDPAGAARAFATLRLLPMFGSPEAAHHWFFSADTPAGQVAGWSDRLCDESFRAVVDTLVRPVRTKRVTTPLLVLGGSADRTAPPQDVAFTAHRYGVEPVVLDGLPHDLMLDGGWQRAAAHIANWLDDTLG
ncbi:alpha/beta hydrolase [Flexivirga endophytica]|uniref:Alpha/beta hydrolase n=1 Tax=Flexivirga endophytica TaxID=1849103 RepID=A0A916X0P2_9MICO|nr:alpha/beta hydrolase [Flexivirga endophytica]GGB45792.1 alpha/beta hydrolase [Flexivirga endophytica]GHB66251.1 alpha/beta hydrolase [Flexivirga endophytica]